MKAYMVVLPSPDGDGYIALDNLAIWARRGELPPSLAQAVLEHRFRLGERTASLPVPNLGVIVFPGVPVFSTLDAARDFGLAHVRKGGIREWAILHGEAEETRRLGTLTDTGDDFEAVAFTPQEVVSTENGE